LGDLRNEYNITAIFDDENLKQILNISKEENADRKRAITMAYFYLIQPKITFETRSINFTAREKSLMF